MRRSGLASSDVQATERFTRELKRLLAFGVLRPERWPELVAAIASTKKEEPT